MAGAFQQIMDADAVAKRLRYAEARRKAGDAKSWAPAVVADLVCLFGQASDPATSATTNMLHLLVTDWRMETVWGELADITNRQGSIAMAAALGAVHGAGDFTLTAAECEERARAVLGAVIALHDALRRAPNVDVAGYHSRLDPIFRAASTAIDTAKEPLFGKRDRTRTIAAEGARAWGAQDDRAFTIRLWNTLPEEGVNRVRLIQTFAQVLLGRDLNERTVLRARDKARTALPTPER